MRRTLTALSAVLTVAGLTAAGVALGERAAFAQGAAAAPAAVPRAQAPKAPATYGIGRPATAAEIAALDIDVRPDGHGLPPGKGTPAEGEALFATSCARCHGKTGKEGPNDVLVGRDPRDGFPFWKDPKITHTVGNYWPYATTVFDYIRRAMPPDAPGSLKDSDVYALTAFLLNRNELLPADAVLDAASLAKVVMPARDRFVPDTRGKAKVAPAPPVKH